MLRALQHQQVLEQDIHLLTLHTGTAMPAVLVVLLVSAVAVAAVFVATVVVMAVMVAVQVHHQAALAQAHAQVVYVTAA